MLKQPDDGALPSCQSVLTCGVNNDATCCRALGDFYNATSGASWITTMRTGWSAAATGTPTDYCTFFGVLCSNGILQQLCVRRICILAHCAEVCCLRCQQYSCCNTQRPTQRHHSLQPWQPDWVDKPVRETRRSSQLQCLGFPLVLLASSCFSNLPALSRRAWAA